jgi:hydroxyacylglutathione hydrolase
VIDPRRDVQVYLDLATAAGLRITHILETHVHADFVSGARELAQVSGATIYASRLGEQAFEHQPVDDGDVVEVGSLRLRALWTPGHTPEHICWLASDPAVSERPQALFSGDMLFVGEVGRPDLLGDGRTDELVNQLYDSIFVRLMPLADDIIVYPGHGAGSACGKSIGDSPSTTLGQEKRFNYAFRPTDRETFKRHILGGMPPAPTYYPTLKRVNKAGPELMVNLPPGGPLPVDTFKQALADGTCPARCSPAWGRTSAPGWAGWRPTSGTSCSCWRTTRSTTRRARNCAASGSTV